MCMCISTPNITSPAAGLVVFGGSDGSSSCILFTIDTLTPISPLSIFSGTDCSAPSEPLTVRMTRKARLRYGHRPTARFRHLCLTRKLTRRHVGYQRMIFGKQLMWPACHRTPESSGWPFNQHAFGQQVLHNATIGLHCALGMGKRSLQMERLRDGKSNWVTCPGSRNQHHPARALLDLLAGHGASAPVDHITQPLRRLSRPGRPHSLVHVDLAEPSPNGTMDDHCGDDIEGSIGWRQIPQCYVLLNIDQEQRRSLPRGRLVRDGAARLGSAPTEIVRRGTVGLPPLSGSLPPSDLESRV